MTCQLLCLLPSGWRLATSACLMNLPAQSAYRRCCAHTIQQQKCDGPLEHCQDCYKQRDKRSARAPPGEDRARVAYIGNHDLVPPRQHDRGCRP
jgi:hypothetical protein